MPEHSRARRSGIAVASAIAFVGVLVVAPATAAAEQDPYGFSSALQQASAG